MPRSTGSYRPSSTAGETVQAFVPHPLPPADPPLHLTPLSAAHDAAMAALARLGVAGRTVPSPRLFLYGFVRKEAVLTSQIEGTQATLRDIATYEATLRTDRPADVEEVCNYIAAFEYARREVGRPTGLPISTRLLCEAHRRLMRGVRGASKNPGRLRRAQNWIGGAKPSEARFVPPPPEDVPGAMERLERWIHAEDAAPPLVRAGLAHVQFETIHPFLDGNGRIGRLLIALLLEHWRLVPAPLLYVSLALKRRQREYYERLSAVRMSGDWEGWVGFFLECVRDAADDGVAVASRLAERLTADRATLSGAKQVTVAALRLLDSLPEHPVVTISSAAEILGVTAPPARKAIDVMVASGILKETTGRTRDRVFAYQKYLRVLTADE